MCVWSWDKAEAYFGNSRCERIWLTAYVSFFLCPGPVLHVLVKSLTSERLHILQCECDGSSVVWGKGNILSAVMSVGVGKAALEQSMLIKSGGGSRWGPWSADQRIITPSVSLCREHCAIVPDNHVANVQYSHCSRPVPAHCFPVRLFPCEHFPSR